MVKQIHIENYKSVQSLDIELGRLNVFIGANGCGKTNILEAIALGSAAAADKLDNEFLGSRGIRMTEAKWMKSGFNTYLNEDGIKISFLDGLDFDENYHIGIREGLASELYLINSPLNDLISLNLEDILKSLFAKGTKFKIPGGDVEIDTPPSKEDLDDMYQIIPMLVKELTSKELEQHSTPFLIFAPENYFLRRFEEESQIKPLGIRGEGLFSHLVELTRDLEVFNYIKEQLQLIDWFEDFEVPNDLMFSQRKIRVKDRFLTEGLQYFDQRSANEGFLYLLFYTTLFISPYTPKFFAIDNIDNSLNPKLCSELTKMLAQLAKDHDKQAILTTHNPAVLDGLNLNDDEQRLFVIYRNADGHTKAERIFKKELPAGMNPVKLSEQFLRGYLGGLNENF